MTTEQQEEAKVLALYVGWEKIITPNFENMLQGPPGSISHLYLPTAKYHTSWDWLRPVWHKFRDEGKTMWFEHRDWTIKISLHILHDYTPELAASELAKAITWLNSIKK